MDTSCQKQKGIIMKTVKWLPLLFLLVVFVLSVPSVSLAENDWEIWIRQAKEVNNGCEIQLNQRNLPIADISKAKAVVTIDGKEYPVRSIRKQGEKKGGCAYLCLVDVSGSMDEGRLEQVRGFLRMLNEGKKKKDSICIVAVGNELRSSGFLKDKGEILGFIDGLAVTGEDTNLYYAIKEEIAELASQDYEKKSMVVFSDGVDVQAEGITREEAQSAVRESAIPVFTVGLLATQSDSDLEGAKVLGSFARYSEGGKHYLPIMDGVGVEEIYGQIRTMLDNTPVITIDAKNLSNTASSYAIQVDLKAKKQTVSASKDVAASDLSGLQEVNIKESVEPEKKQIPRYVWGIIAGCAAFALIICFVLILRRKKQREKLRTNLILTRVRDHKEIRKDIIGEIKMGRSERCQLRFIEDEALSEYHCSFLFDGQTMKIVDEDSTNGTYVNGVRIHGAYELQQNDIILAGADKYTVNWGVN